jgi:uncharacterized protein YndB with AHSA1/START domain
MTTQHEVRVEREIHIEARPETVFPFFTDAAKISQWFGSHAMLDARPGGVFRVAINKEAIARGEFRTVEPPNRVVFTFGWEGDDVSHVPGTSTVEVTLTAEAGGTRVRFLHTHLPADAVAQHDQGWAHYLSRLAIVAIGQDPGPDKMACGA